MKKDRFDDLLKEQLKKETEKIQPSDFLKVRIDMEMMERERQEEYIMKKKMSVRKWAVAAVIACLLVPTGAFAVGKITGYESSIDIRSENIVKSWDKVSGLEAEMGFEADAEKSFSNGYTFKKGYILPVDAKDAEGNSIFTYDELWLSYKGKSGKELNLIARGKDERIDKEAQKETADHRVKYGDTDVRLYKDTYKFVPPDYEKTKEDVRLEAQNNYHISYGSDKVEISDCVTLRWEKSGICYSMQAMDTDLSEQELLHMAKEIIEK